MRALHLVHMMQRHTEREKAIVSKRLSLSYKIEYYSLTTQSVVYVNFFAVKSEVKRTCQFSQYI